MVARSLESMSVVLEQNVLAYIASQPDLDGSTLCFAVRVLMRQLQVYTNGL